MEAGRREQEEEVDKGERGEGRGNKEERGGGPFAGAERRETGWVYERAGGRRKNNTF